MRAAARPGGEIAAAFGMLTRIPVRSSSRDATGAAAYGLVGAVVGALGGLVMVVLGEPVPTLAAVLAVGAMAVASGAVHLDGLADTTDALLARDAAQAEIARKDPAIGSGGVVALIVVLAIQVAALASLAVLPGGSGPVVAGLACVSAGAVSRALPVVVVLLRGDAIGRVGLGAWFAERVRVLDGISAAVTAALVAVVTRAAGRGDRVRCRDRGRCRCRRRDRARPRARPAAGRRGHPRCDGRARFRGRRHLGGDRDGGDVARPLILALGGTRSGKSRFGLAATRRLAGDGRAWFLATAWPGDPEMDDRIARHQRERPDDWPTIEVGTRPCRRAGPDGTRPNPS